MTDIDVPDWVTTVALDAYKVSRGSYEGEVSPDHDDMQAALRAALSAWVVPRGHIAIVELCSLNMARDIGRKDYATIWSEPTGQAGVPLYTLRQEKPE